MKESKPLSKHEQMKEKHRANRHRRTLTSSCDELFVGAADRGVEHPGPFGRDESEPGHRPNAAEPGYRSRRPDERADEKGSASVRPSKQIRRADRLDRNHRRRPRNGPLAAQVFASDPRATSHGAARLRAQQPRQLHQREHLDERVPPGLQTRRPLRPNEQAQLTQS